MSGIETKIQTVTSHGLDCWYKAMVEKLGWVILHERINKKKPDTYRESLTHLHQEIERWNSRTNNPEPLRSDLVIMRDNVEYLISHIDSMRAVQGGGGKKPKKSKKNSKKR